MKINEFEQEFRGFDTEVDYFNVNSYSGLGVAKKDKLKIFRANDLDTVLNLAPHQLIEIIAGNVINPFGFELDINYQPLKLGDSNKIPKARYKESFMETALASRRGIGYHFQLSSKVSSKDSDSSSDSYIHSIDKEGVLKISIPKSSDTGNILIPDSTSFYSNDGNIDAKWDSQVPDTENIPVTLSFAVRI